MELLSARIDMEGLVAFGFYICRAAEYHPLSNQNPNKMISASDCLCYHEPQIFLCHGWKPRGDDENYISRFRSKDEYLKMSEEINGLYNSGLFFEDGRFARIEDALYFFNTYFRDQDLILISVSSRLDYLKTYEDIKYYGNDDMEGFDAIGMDILGWDNCSFHSFLCNSLQDEFPDIRFNKYGFIETDYETAALIASKIQGKGEPVDWFPVAVYRIR